MGKLFHDQDLFECFGVAAPLEAFTEVGPAPPLPGTNRRNWVYREIAQLGADAAPWIDSAEFD